MLQQRCICWASTKCSLFKHMQFSNKLYSTSLELAILLDLSLRPFNFLLDHLFATKRIWVVRTLQHIKAGNCSLIDVLKDTMRYRISLKDLNNGTGKQAMHSEKVSALWGKSQGMTVSQEMSLGTQIPINCIDPECSREDLSHCGEVDMFRNDSMKKAGPQFIFSKVFPKFLKLWFSFLPC